MIVNRVGPFRRATIKTTNPFAGRAKFVQTDNQNGSRIDYGDIWCYDSPLPNAPFTITQIVRITSVPLNASPWRVGLWGTVDTVLNRFLRGMYMTNFSAGAASISFSLYDDSGNQNIITVPGGLAAGTAYFLGMTYDGNNLAAFVNGSHVGSVTMSGPAVSFSPDSKTGVNILNLGAGVAVNYSVDDIRFFQSALTLSELQALQLGVPIVPLPLSTIRLDSSSISDGPDAIMTKDTSVGSTTGIAGLTETATTITNLYCPPVAALYWNIPRASFLGGNFSLSFWARTDMWPSSAGEFWLPFTSQDVGFNDSYFQVSLERNAGPGSAVINVNAGNAQVISSPGTVLEASWQNFVVTYSSAGLLRVYIGGNLVGSSVGAPPSPPLGDTYFATNLLDFVVGAGVTGSDPMLAALSDLRVYTRVLGATEITAIANKQIVFSGLRLRFTLERDYGTSNTAPGITGTIGITTSFGRPGITA